MEKDLFDRLTIAFSARQPRRRFSRRAVGGTAALLAAVGLGGLGFEETEAESCLHKCKDKNTKKKRRRCRKKCKNKQECRVTDDCPSGEVCEDGTCIPGPGQCTTDNDCDDCERCDSGVCVGICAADETCIGTGADASCCLTANVCNNGTDAACCPPERCISDGGVCCPEDFIACGLACCGDDTPVCVSPGTCGPAIGSCPGGSCTGGPGSQGTCASASCNCDGDPGLCVACTADNAACTIDDECCGDSVCCPGAGNTCQAVCI